MSPAMGWTPPRLGYCGNVHPAHDLAALRASIAGPFQAVRRQRGLPCQDSGLWISARAAAELQQPGPRAAFLAQLKDCGLRLTSLNGFPHGRFHGGHVKSGVYRPDWSESPRLDYSLQLAALLAEALPEDCEQGVISSVPLGYAADWSIEHLARAEMHLLQLTEALAQLKRRTGKNIRLCLEMEPDCVLEHTDQALAFFAHWQARDPNHDHLALCFDVCHQAVLFEDCHASLSCLRQAGIAIGKIQLSNALVCRLPGDGQRREEVLAVLGGFAEGTYLHQVKARHRSGQLLAWADLPAALLDPALAGCSELRVHFHVPLFSERFQLPELGGSQQALGRVFEYLAQHPDFRPALEVETYSWMVLPEALRPGSEAALASGIAAELDWVQAQLQRHGVLAGEPLREVRHA